MRDDEKKQQAANADSEPATKPEPAKKPKERRDTLTDDNPLICRGTD